MASLGHLAVGMAAARTSGPAPRAARASLGAVLFWSALSFLPDADVIGFGLGIAYGDEWGHRGASHSFVFALAIGAAIGALAPRFRRPAVRTGLVASLVLATHPLLDVFTNGGLGCALFWPFDLTRYFAPWTPIPVSPIGLGYLSPYGMYVAASELALFAPLFWLALRRGRAAHESPRRRSRTATLVLFWVVALWLLFSPDPFRERIVLAALLDDTEFAPGVSEGARDGIDDGQRAEQVRATLGEPFNRVETPVGDCWIYSRSPDGGYFRGRAVCFQATARRLAKPRSAGGCCGRSMPSARRSRPVAACAVTQEAELWTLNPAAFSGLPGLRLYEGGV
jgi:inner membrane protein